MGAKKSKEIPAVVEKKPKVIKHKITTFFKSLVSTKKRKILTIIVSALILIGIIFAIPVSRYFILSPFVKKDVSLKVIDATTKRPVSNANVIIGSVSSQSDKDGVVNLKSVPVGQYELKVQKQYYEDYTTKYTVPVLSAPQSLTLDINAIGRQVSVSISNKISGEPLANVVIEANGTSATTSDDGTATIILPPEDATVKAVLSKDGYNSTDVELKVDDSIVNTYSIVPSGTIYYLSKATGKINVMKSNLDGSNASVAIAGTGQESDYATSLLSARDWKYSAFKATRTDNKERLYLIDATKDDFTVMDEGNATFNLVGWSGHNFIYTVERKGNYWDDKRQSIKSFNADTKKITTLDTTFGSGSSWSNIVHEQFSGIYIMENELVYLKSWGFGTYAYHDPNKTNNLYSINPTGGSKKTIKAFPNTVYPELKLYAPRELYIRVSQDGTSVFYEYEDGDIETININDNKFESFYPTFLISPSGKQTLWYEPRDGKNSVFIGDENGENTKTIGNLSEYTPYGWYGANDEYVLLTKKGSELYISPSSKVIGEGGYQPLKVTDYHKTQTYPGYGYGYGGQ